MRDNVYTEYLFWFDMFIKSSVMVIHNIYIGKRNADFLWQLVPFNI